MPSFLKCMRCDWIDYLEDSQTRCPVCASKTETVENLFAGETITYVVTSITGRKTKVTTVFETFVEKFDRMVPDKELDNLFDDSFSRNRFKVMMRAYIWLMLRREPQLWLHTGFAVKGLKELMMLRIRSQK